MAQDCFVPIDNFSILEKEHIKEYSNFWNDIKKAGSFPEECVESLSTEKIEIYFLHDSSNPEESKFIFNTNNEFFRKEVMDLEAVFLKHVKASNTCFIFKFQIIFEFRESSYSGIMHYNKQNGNHFYNNNILVISGQHPPKITKGG